ncbi:hypothetical protein [Tropicimonas sp. IMCC6043]|uniref:hypothetical protein n=1 Tax=Tropicimonas sp. IMCC6043 TaxID=2510645 RepID=UPI00101C122F|nr:hypothetical protein [Tropicimonas sp. IMCC6043]RYH09967.1 hypothetical protein EU800_10490 [Tropicimonas sp. IMCC6043]
MAREGLARLFRRVIATAASAAILLCGPGLAEEPHLLVFDMESASSGSEPLLTIAPDGVAELRAVPNRIAAIRTKLPPERVAEIVGFLTGDANILAVDTEEIRAEMTRQGMIGNRMNVADAPTTRIALSLHGSRIEIRFYAVSEAARDFPGIQGLADLRKAERYLLALVSELRGG